MKRLLSVLSAVCVLLSLLAVCASAWETPELSLRAEYSESDKTVTAYLTVLHFAGTESADYRIGFDKDALTFKSCETPDLGPDQYFVSGLDIESGDRVNIAYYTMYYAPEEVCAADGSCLVATVVFDVKEDAKKAKFSVYTESCAMDPDSTRADVKPVSLEIGLTGDGSEPHSGEARPVSGAGRTALIAGVTVAAVAAVSAAAVIVIKKRGKKA